MRCQRARPNQPPVGNVMAGPTCAAMRPNHFRAFDQVSPSFRSVGDSPQDIGAHGPPAGIGITWAIFEAQPRVALPP